MFTIVAITLVAGCAGAELLTTNVVAVKFYAEIFSSEHFNVTQCVNGQPLYDFNSGDDINVDVYVNNDSTITDIICILDAEEFHPNYSVTRNGPEQHINIKFQNVNTSDVVPVLSCGINMANLNTIIDCTTRLKRADLLIVGTTIYFVETHIAATLALDFQTPYIMKEIPIHNNGSLTVKCDMTHDIEYRYAVIRKGKDGRMRTVGTKDSIYSFSLKERFNILEYACIGTHKLTSKKHEAALRIKYLSTEPSNLNIV